MSDSDLSSGDPWDIAVPAPDPTPAEVADDATTDTAVDVTPPPPPAVEPTEADDDAPDVEPADVPSLDDFDTDALSADMPAVPELDVPDLDMSEISAAPINVSDVADASAEAVDLDVPDLDVPELDVTDLDVTDLDVTEIGVPDIDLPDVDVPEVVADIDLDAADPAADIDFAALSGGDTDVELDELGSSSRGPLSAMLAGTGLFGDSDTAEDGSHVSDDSAVETSEDGADLEIGVGESDVPDLATPADSPPWGGTDSELPDDAPDWLDQDAGADAGGRTDSDGGDPPSVYKELEELGKIDGADPSVEGSVEDFGALYGSDDDAIDTEQDDDDFGISFGTGDTDDVTADDDVARVAAMVADVEPIIESSESVEHAADSPPADLDWLDNDDEIGLGGDDMAPVEIGGEGESHPDVSGADVSFGEIAVDDHATHETEAADTTFEVADGASESDFSIPEVRFDEPTIEQTPEPPELPSHADLSSSDVTPEADAPAAALVAADPFGDLDATTDAADLPSEAADLIDDDSDSEGDSYGEDDASGIDTIAADDSSFDGDLQDGPDGQEDADDVDGVALLDQPDESTRGRSPDWGSRWEESQQGWVDGEWRPIVAAGDTLAAWSVDVYLGVVVGDALIDSLSADNLAAARGVAEAAMLDEATARGAHAVVSVTSRVEQVGSQMVVSASGTAVTLTADGSAETP